MPTRKFKPETVHDPLVSLLNQHLAGVIDFALAAKQAHWNVKGENFIALHELFDRVAREVTEYADLLAERAVQLHGFALGTLQEVHRHSGLAPYPTAVRDGRQHIKELSEAAGMLAESMRSSINTAAGNHDQVTTDILTEITRGIDKLRWLLESHIST